MESPRQKQVLVRGGRFLMKNWVLLYETQFVSVKEDGKFELEIPVTPELTQLNFSAVGPLGEIKYQSYDLTLKEAEEGSVKIEREVP